MSRRAKFIDMKIWDDIRNYFYKKALAEKMESAKVKRAITNLADAKTVGVIYDSTNPDNDIIITRFAENLRKQGKQVELLGFVDDKKIDHKADIQVFNKTRLTWTRVPNDPRVDAFTAKNFDLLLACFTGENFPLEFVAATAKAKWRVGPYAAGKVAYYDMMINMSGKSDLAYLLEQMVNFLNNIKYDSK